MRRSLLYHTRTFLLPLLAVGLLLTGCDSSGSSDGEDDVIPLSVETAHNLLAADLKSQTDAVADEEPSESELKTRYNGNTDGVSILTASRVSSAAQTEYKGTSLTGAVSGGDLVRSSALEEGVDSPGAGAVTADELITFYLGEMAKMNSSITDNQVNMSQLVNKLLLGGLMYARGAEALTSIDGTAEDDVENLNAAATYFGAPNEFSAEFLDYGGGTEGLANTAVDLNEDEQIDFNTEFVFTWASYAAERSAVAENNGTPNDFARRAKGAMDDLRTAIEEDDSSVDVDAKAATALEAWESVVAVNVIHYVNAMESDLSSLDSDETVTTDALSDDAVAEFNEHWGEAKPFAWALQFNPEKQVSDTQLQNLHDALGAAPPYGKTKSEVVSDIDTVKQILADTYDFNASNVENW
jgi:hypothetical protein